MNLKISGEVFSETGKLLELNQDNPGKARGVRRAETGAELHLQQDNHPEQPDKEVIGRFRVWMSIDNLVIQSVTLERDDTIYCNTMSKSKGLGIV